MAKAIENQRCTAVHIAKNVTLKTAKTGQETALPVKFVGTQFFCYEKSIITRLSSITNLTVFRY